MFQCWRYASGNTKVFIQEASFHSFHHLFFHCFKLGLPTRSTNQTGQHFFSIFNVLHGLELKNSTNSETNGHNALKIEQHFEIKLEAFPDEQPAKRYSSDNNKTLKH